jgi:hypothetical protein
MRINLFFALISSTLLPNMLSADEYRPQLFSSIKLVYEDGFSDGPVNRNHWQVRQGTTWSVKDGALSGSPSPKEFQDKMIAAGDKAHAGFKPVIWLEKVPENLVVQFRVRFDAESYHPKFPLIDVGHHVNTLTFSETGTTLTLKKNQKVIKTDQLTLKLNQWAEVTIELKQGTMALKIDDKQEVFSDPLIDMIGQQQIDFKGVDHGAIHIDNVKVYEGLP